MADEPTGTASTGIVMYESNWCGFCRAARRLIESKGWTYEAKLVDGNRELRQQMQTLTGKTSVPQIFFGEHHVGGYDDMAELESDGELDPLYAEHITGA